MRIAKLPVKEHQNFFLVRIQRKKSSDYNLTLPSRALSSQECPSLNSPPTICQKKRSIPRRKNKNDKKCQISEKSVWRWANIVSLILYICQKRQEDSENFPYLPLHDLVLRQAGGVGVHGHGVSASGGLVLDEAQAKRAAAVLVSRELGNGSVSVVDGVETNNTSAARTSIGLVLDLGLLNLADCGEELNEILIAG